MTVGQRRMWYTLLAIVIAPVFGLVLLSAFSHRPDNLGYAGRRVLVSRKWSGKTLADHRGEVTAHYLGYPAGCPAERCPQRT